MPGFDRLLRLTRLKGWLACLLLVVGLCPIPASAASQAARPRIGLVLSGGGARGAAHIGVLEVLEELRIPIDYVTGNSMGAIVGGYYAVGYSPEELEAEITGIDWVDIFTDLPKRRELALRRKEDSRNFLVKWRLGFRDGAIRFPKGLVQGQKLEVKLKTLALPAWDVTDFDDLPLPFRAVATDIGTGEAVILGGGNLGRAIRASMSVPGVFAPVEIDGRLLVDGMLSNNIPIDAVKEFGPDIVIAIDVGTPPLRADQIESAFAVAGQSASLLMQAGTLHQLELLGEDDILLTVGLEGLSTANFGEAARAIELGRVAAEGIVDRLAHLSVSEEEWQAYLARQRKPDRPLPVIDEVRVESNSRLSPRLIESRMRVQPGETLDPEALDRDLGQIYGLDLFESVEFSLVQEGEGTVLEVYASEKSWGANNIRFGFNIQENFEDTHEYRMGAQINVLPINALGAEWRTEVTFGTELRLATELYQPISYSAQWFVAADVEYTTPELNLFVDGDAVARYRRRLTTVAGTVGRQLGRWGEVRVGLGYVDERAAPILGSSDLPIGRLSDPAYFVRGLVDTLDRTTFATWGERATLGLVGVDEGFGGDQSFQLLQGQLQIARSWRDNTVTLNLYGATGFGDTNFQTAFALGGFQRLSGLPADAISGDTALFGSLVLYRRIAAPAVLNIELPVYVGGSVETGGTWQRDEPISSDELLVAGSLFVGADTPLGPLFLAGGFAEDDNYSAYLFIGLPF